MSDDFDIKSLPTDFGGKSKKSRVLERFLEKRQKIHEEVVSSIEVQKNEVNLKVNEKVENEGERLKKSLKQYKKEVEDKLYVLKHRVKFTLEKNEWNNTIEKINKIHNDRINIIEEYHHTLSNLENERTKLFKGILKEAYRKILDTSFKLPYEIGEFFEFEILRSNQMTLSNFHTYNELKCDLLQETEEDMRQWTFALQELKEVHLEFIKIRAEACVETYKKIELKDVIQQNEDLRKESDKLNNDVLQLKQETSNVPINLVAANEWLKNIQITLACLDLSAKNFIGFYKMATVIIFNRFFDELDFISKSIEYSGIVHRGSVDTVQYEIYTPTIEEMGIKFESDVEKLKNLWGEIINTMSKTVSDTYKFLTNVVTLWDFHFKRIEGLQYLVLQDVKQTINANNKSAKSSEIKLNVLIDTLRQESTAEKVNKCMDDVKNTLNDIEHVYLQQFNTESLVLRKYKQYVDIAVDVLMSEIKRFAVIHPPDFDKDPKKQRKRASQTSEIIDPNDELIPMQMVYCRFQVDAVGNWMFGLSEAINNYIENGKNELLQAAEEWIKKETDKLDHRMKIRIAFHRSRYERTKANIYDVRIKELCFHTNRIQEHKNAVERLIYDINIARNDSENYCQNCLNEYDQKISDIKTKMSNSKSFGSANALVTIMKAATEKTLQMIISNVKNVEDTCKNVMENVKLSNMKLVASVKMFSEDGNFGLQEAKDIIKNLGKIYASTEKSVNNFIKEAKAKEVQYTKTLDTKNNDISSKIKNFIDEFRLIEDTKRKLKMLQNNIKKEVCSSKYEFKKIRINFEKFQNESEKNLGDHRCFSTFAQEFKGILEETNRIDCYLAHPEPVAIYSATLNQLSTERYVSSKSTSKIEEKELEKYTKTLFSYTIEAENNFISNLNKLLQGSWFDITKNAKEFYGKHSVFDLDEDKIHHSFERFLEEISQTFQIYQVQYEIEWMREAAAFTKFVNFLKTFLGNYLKCFIGEFCNLNFKKIENLYKCQISRWKEEKNIIESFYINMHEKLKPIYGHPKNKRLLENLENEFKNFSQDMEEKIENFSQPYISNLAETFEESKSAFIKLKDEIFNIKEEILESIKTDIKSQLETKTELAKNIIKNRTGDTENCSDIITFIFEYLATVDENILEKLCPSIESFSQFSTSSNCTEKNCECFLEDLSYKYDEYANHFRDINDIAEFVRKLQEQWRISVEQILQLCRVKYDEIKRPLP